MKYITTSGPVVETLPLGAIGQTKTFRLVGNAAFADGTKSKTVVGVQDVPITIAANVALKPKFVEVFEADRRIETYCVLSAPSVRWSLAALRGIGNHLDWKSSGICVINLVTNVETTLTAPDTPADPWLDYILVPDTSANCVWALRSNTTLTAPTVGRVIQLSAAPVATAISRGATDERTHLFVDAAGRVHYLGHDFQQLRAPYEINKRIVSGAFTYNGAVVTGFVFCDETGTLYSVAVSAAFAFGPVLKVDDVKTWTRVQTDPSDTARVYCVTDAATDNGFIYNGTAITPAFAGEAYTGLGVTDTGYAHGAYLKAVTDTGAATVSFASVAGQLLYPASGKYLFTDGKRYEAGALTGSVPDGRTVLGIIFLDGVAHAVCAKANVEAIRTDSSNHTTTLTIASKEPAAGTLTLLIDVAGTAGNAFEIGLPENVRATFTVAGKPVSSVQAGQQLQVVLETGSIPDNLFNVAIGRTALAEPMIPDELPDVFVIGNLYDVAPDQTRTTVPVTPVAYDTPIPVHSNGIILIDGVEVADGTLIRPGQTLSIKITQSQEFLNSWWVTTGALRTEFVSLQQEQPVTVGIKSRAYAPLGTFRSRMITNSYGVNVLVQLGDVGKFDNTDARSILLGVGQVAVIELEVTEHIHYEIPYTFGRTQHVLQVWAEDHFLDVEPTTTAAERWVPATSAAFPFGAIPPNFYVVATAPAGVLISLDGEALPSEPDARGYNKAEEQLEFDVDQPLTYTAIPFAGGRTLDFGDVQAHWHYDPTVTGTKLEKQTAIKLAAKQLAVETNQLITLARTPIVEQVPATFVLYPMRKHQGYVASAAASHEGNGVGAFTAPAPAGVESPRYHHNDFMVADVGVAKPNVAEASVRRTFAELEFQILAPTHYDVAAATAKSVQLRHQGVESLNFTYVQRSFAETQAAQYARVEEQRAAGLSLSPSAVAARKSEGLEVQPQLVGIPTIAHVEALVVSLSVARTAEGLDVKPTFQPVSEKQYLELNSVQKQITGLASRKIEARNSQYREPDTIPIRPLYRQAKVNSVGIEARSYVYPRSYEMEDPTPGITVFNHSMPWQMSLASTSMQLNIPYKLDNSTLEFVETHHQSAEPVFPQSFTKTRNTYQPRDVKFSPSSAVTDHSPRTADFAQTGTQSREGRVIGFNLATSHDGNPDLLDRGYFATELEALQDATGVWGKDASEVVARKLPTGQWYWATPDLCVNMCSACPPYGYLSGG